MNVEVRACPVYVPSVRGLLRLEVLLQKVRSGPLQLKACAGPMRNVRGLVPGCAMLCRAVPRCASSQDAALEREREAFGAQAEALSAQVRGEQMELLSCVYVQRSGEKLAAARAPCSMPAPLRLHRSYQPAPHLVRGAGPGQLRARWAALHATNTINQTARGAKCCAQVAGLQGHVDAAFADQGELLGRLEAEAAEVGHPLRPLLEMVNIHTYSVIDRQRLPPRKLLQRLEAEAAEVGDHCFRHTIGKFGSRHVLLSNTTNPLVAGQERGACAACLAAAGVQAGSQKAGRSGVGGR